MARDAAAEHKSRWGCATVSLYESNKHHDPHFGYGKVSIFHFCFVFSLCVCFFLFEFLLFGFLTPTV